MPRNSIGGTRTHVILSDPQREQLERLAKKTGLTVSEHLRRAADFYLTKVAQQLSSKKA